MPYTVGNFLCRLHCPEEWAGVDLLYVFALDTQKAVNAGIKWYAGGQLQRRTDPVASAADKPAASDLIHELAAVLAVSAVGRQ